MAEVYPLEATQPERSDLAELFNISRREATILAAGAVLVASLAGGALAGGKSIAESDEPVSLQAAETHSISVSSQHPLGTPQAAPAGRGSYRYLEKQEHDPSPVRWSPCEPIRFVINPDKAPANAIKALEAAVPIISAATGLKLVYEGPTDEEVVPDRPMTDRARYGERYSPVLVDIVTAAQYPKIKGYAGLGGPTVATITPNFKKNVSGVVILNKDYFNGIATEDNATARANAVLIHELGHLVGLDHVDDRSQLMYKAPGVNTLKAGDLRGLNVMGKGACGPAK